MANVKPIVSGGQDTQLTLEQAAAKAKQAENRQAKRLSKKQNNVAVSNTYTKVPFYYADGRMVGIPMQRKIAKGLGLPEMPRKEYDTTSDGKIKGKGIGKFKGKKVKVSRGYQLKERKTSTKGRKTGIGKRSISLTKSYTRVWASFRVPLDATVTDIIFWIKNKFKPAAYPEVLAVGDQQIDLGLRKTKAEHKAEIVTGRGLVKGVDGMMY